MNSLFRIPVKVLIENRKLYIGDGYRAKNSELSDNGIPFARAGNLNNGFNFNVTDYFPIDMLKKVGNKRSKIGDVVFTSKGTVGRLGFVTYRTHEFVYSPQLCFWRSLDHKTIYPRYLLYWMNSRFFLDQVNVVSGSTDMAPYVNLGDQRKMKIDLPPLPIQHAVASILSSYDELIENNNQRIKLLEEMAEEIYKEWFVRMRFPAYENTKFFNEEGKEVKQVTIGALPEGWEKKSVDNFSSFRMSNAKLKKFNGEKTYLATADISGIDISGKGEIIDWENKPSRAQLVPELNSVFFARMSNTYKILVFCDTNKELINELALTSGFLGFKAKNEYVLPFLFWFIKSPNFHNYKDVYANGATQVSLTNEGLHMIKLVEPNMTIIEEFGKITLPFLNEILLLNKKNQLLQQTRDLLLPRLISGKLSVEHLVEEELLKAAEQGDENKNK
ncbi:MAG: restriction endonuclease subunit S [Bacteroidales bacterium]